MGCTSCGGDLPEGAAFCPRCGTPQVAPGCTQCGAELVAGAAFCFKCGTPLAASGPVPAAVVERRLTSVLFADLVGYTSLSESRDTEEVRELLSAYFDTCQTVIKRFGGTVEKFIGDAVMAVWGVPVSHEDDAGRAVRAGLELVSEVGALGERTALPGLALRVGILSGEVTANLSADNQGIVAGDPVNTAARIQAVAQAGEVWVDPETRLLTTAEVRYVDMGEHALKGKTEPLRLFRAVEVSAGRDGAQRVDGLEAPLVGRDRELRLLKELFHVTEETGRSQLVVLDGEAGVGKSRLGWEFEKYLDGLPRTVRWHRGRCVSYGDGVAFWALAEAVRGRLGVVEDDTGLAALAALDTLLADLVADEQERGWLRSRLGFLLGEHDGGFSREDLFAAWSRWFDWVGGEDPVVLLIEDAQHADDGLVDFLEHLLSSTRTGCFVVALARPELLEARPTLGGRRATPIRIEPLAPIDMTSLVEGLVGGLSRDVTDALVRRAEGIPLYAVETVRALIDRDLVIPREGRYVVASGVEVDLEAVGAPTSLHALVAARLDALSAAERKVVADASVLGLSFTRESIGILAADVPDLDAVLASLIRKELLDTESDRFSAERGQYRFVQSVVRQVAYETLSRRDRKQRHLLVAEHLGAEQERLDELAQMIAQHLLEAAAAAGGNDDDVPRLRSRASALLVRAGTRAGALGAYADAARSFRAAMECQDDPVERGRILLADADLLRRGARPLEASERAREALTQLDEVGAVIDAGHAAYVLARSVNQLDRASESIEIARTRYDALAEVPGAEHARGRLASALALALHFAGRDEEVNAPLQEALRCSERVDDPELFRIACHTLALTQQRNGSDRVARLLLADIAERARERSDWVALESSAVILSVSVATQSLTDAIAQLVQAYDDVVALGIEPDISLVTNLLNYRWLAGDWDALEPLMRAEFALDSDFEQRLWTPASVYYQCRWSGRDLEVDLPEVVDLPGQAFASAGTFRRGSQALVEGDVRSAVGLLCESVEAEFDLNGVSDDLHVFWPMAMRVALEAEDEEAIGRLWAVAAAIEALPALHSLQGHLSVFSAVRGLRSGADSPEDLEQRLRSGIDVLGRTGVGVWRAWAEEDLARLLLAQSRTEEAQLQLKSARETFDQMGADRWVSRVDEMAQVSSR